MKKFNKLSLIIVMLIVVALCAISIVACDQHQHNYSEWDHNADQHWKYCPADNSIDESSKAAHSFGEDGLCECGYEKPEEGSSGHTHSYDANGDCSCGDHQHVWASEYSHDDNGHWISCIKQGCDGKKEEGEHSYDEALEGCVCGIHIHKFAQEWSTDETSHWHDCVSSLCQGKSDEGTHNDADNDEICDVCGRNMHVHDITMSNIVLPHYDYDDDDMPFVDGSAHITCSKSGCIDKDIVLKLIPFETSVSEENVEEDVYYCVCSDYNIFYGMPEGLEFSLGDSTSANLFYIRDDSSYEWSVYDENIDGDVSFEGMSAAIIRMSSSDGNMSFEVNHLIGHSSSNPIVINKDQQYKGSISGYLYMSYTADADGKLLVINHSAADDISLSFGDTYCMDEYNACQVSAGSSYSIVLSGYGEYDVQIIDYSAEDHIGYTYTDPIVLSSDSYSATGAAGTRYYKYVAQSEGKIAVSSSSDISYSLHYIDNTSGYLRQHYSIPTLSVGDEIYIKISSGIIGSYSFEVQVGNDIPFDHTFTIMNDSGEALSGITVSVGDKSGVTDSEGQVILNFVPGEYEISLSGYDTSQYLYSSMSTDPDEQSYDIRLGAIKSNKFTVVDGDGKALEGIKVVLRQGQNASGAIVAFGVTDSEGIVTINYTKSSSKMFVDIESNDYVVSSLSAEGLASGQQYFSVSSFAGKDMTLTLGSASAEPEPEKKVLNIGSNNISVEIGADGWPVVEEYTFTSEEGGDFVISFDKSQYQYVEVIIGRGQPILYYYLSEEEGYEDEYQDSYEFHLDPGASITFKMNTMSYDPDQYVLNLAHATVSELSRQQLGRCQL